VADLQLDFVDLHEAARSLAVGAPIRAVSTLLLFSPLALLPWALAKVGSEQESDRARAGVDFRQGCDTVDWRGIVHAVA
jgi:hypothetical protein